ncbi:MAG: pantoate--beta-alanine ligase [Acidobacteriota bacterium]|jgi:pantoate--beta-alanine ligase
MITIHDHDALRPVVDRWRAAGETIAFVPTMGALHEGHLSLVRTARERADRVVVSIFVNPTQFDQASDLSAYPRTPERDAELLEACGCDLLYLPTEQDLYPEGSATWVVPEGAAEGLEGAHRPGHFRGVATVVLKLFHQVRPDLAVFGEKDAQQLAVIRQMARDLFLPVEIVAGETVREEDGLAMSSRNVRLGPAGGGDREAALVLSRALRAGVEAAERAGEGGDAGAVRAAMRRVLKAEPRARVDYAEVVDARTFRHVDRLSAEVILPLAVRIGEVRLIDNARVQLGIRN